MHVYPITPRNSTVLGRDARAQCWRRWWRQRALWREAVPTPGWSGCLNVPMRPREFDAWYRVRPKREGKARAVRRRGRWFWEYA